MTPRGSHDEGAECLCVDRHIPKPIELHRHHVWPLSEGGPDTEDNVVWLCPTSHVAVHEMLREFKRYEGVPPWDRRNDVNLYIRVLAEEGWLAIDAARAKEG